MDGKDGDCFCEPFPSVAAAVAVLCMCSFERYVDTTVLNDLTGSRFLDCARAQRIHIGMFCSLRWYCTALVFGLTFLCWMKTSNSDCFERSVWPPPSLPLSSFLLRSLRLSIGFSFCCVWGLGVSGLVWSKVSRVCHLSSPCKNAIMIIVWDHNAFMKFFVYAGFSFPFGQRNGFVGDNEISDQVSHHSEGQMWFSKMVVKMILILRELTNYLGLALRINYFFSLCIINIYIRNPPPSGNHLTESTQKPPYSNWKLFVSQQNDLTKN